MYSMKEDKSRLGGGFFIIWKGSNPVHVYLKVSYSELNGNNFQVSSTESGSEWLSLGGKGSSDSCT